MRTMFIKLFFWFWLATILSGMVFFLLAFNLRLGPAFDEHMRHFDAERNGVLSQALACYGRAAAAEHERAKSQGGISDAQPGAQGGMQGYLFAADGSALSQGGATKLRDAVRRMAAGGDAASAGVGGDVVVVKVLGPSGKSYWAAAQSMHGQPPRKPFRRFPFPPDFWLQMLITFVVSGFVCYGLSWRITAPVRKLRAAVQGLALGDLATRVSVSGEAAGDELSDLGRDFNLMAVRIEKLVTAHKQLVRDVSHELRSPLARLNVALGLARKQSPPSAEPALDRIEVEGERLNLLIGELLTLSQLEGGAAGERTGVELSALAEEVARDADFEGCASNRRVHYTPAPPLVVQGDREMLRRALENVVRNAVRYTEEGSSVELQLRLDAGQAVLRVRDCGPGVPEELLSDIFRPFYRVAQARDRQSGGTGIGLAIAERIVTLHGGTVVARNLPGSGLEVEIRLPLTARG
jgi:signal transduction histidine kinase